MSRDQKNFPANATRVFKGEIFDVWQWPQKMFDGSVATFERIARPDTVDVIAVTPNNKILILNQEQPGKPPFISLPGGRLDDGEEPLAGAKRELLEETGYASNDWENFLAADQSGKLDWVLYTFVARGVAKKDDPHLDPGEKISCQEISLDEFINLLDNPLFREIQLRETMLKARYDKTERKKLEELLFK